MWPHCRKSNGPRVASNADRAMIRRPRSPQAIPMRYYCHCYWPRIPRSGERVKAVGSQSEVNGKRNSQYHYATVGLQFSKLWKNGLIKNSLNRLKWKPFDLITSNYLQGTIHKLRRQDFLIFWPPSHEIRLTFFFRQWCWFVFWERSKTSRTKFCTDMTPPPHALDHFHFSFDTY